jgi:prevent-host-death family protein
MSERMTRYKRFGQMLVVEPPPKVVEEVSVRELSRNTSHILNRVGHGTRAVVTSRGLPVAVILEVEEAVGLCGAVLLTRQEAERRLFGEELDERLRERSARRMRRRRRFAA